MCAPTDYNLGEYFSTLPPEMTFKVLSFVPGWDLAHKVVLLNKDFNFFATHNFLWKEKTVRKFHLKPIDAKDALEEGGKGICPFHPTDEPGFWRAKYVELCHLCIRQVESNLLEYSDWVRPLLSKQIFPKEMTDDKDYMMILVKRGDSIFKKAGKNLKRDMDFQREVRRIHGLRRVARRAIPRLLFNDLKGRL